jgi:hypothetical protein
VVLLILPADLLTRKHSLEDQVSKSERNRQKRNATGDSLYCAEKEQLAMTDLCCANLKFRSITSARQIKVNVAS